MSKLGACDQLMDLLWNKSCSGYYMHIRLLWVRATTVISLAAGITCTKRLLWVRATTIISLAAGITCSAWPLWVHATTVILYRTSNYNLGKPKWLFTSKQHWSLQVKHTILKKIEKLKLPFNWSFLRCTKNFKTWKNILNQHKSTVYIIIFKVNNWCLEISN